MVVSIKKGEKNSRPLCMKSEYNKLQSRFDILTKQPASVKSFEPLLGRYKSKVSIEELKKDLIKNPKLIPIEGVLGGKMMFYSSDKIFVLNSKWVIAYFEDGHIAGNALLQFDISKSNEITWKVISTVAE